ncbi:COP9 signalosome complex subunit 2 [Perkinsus chesapeaki]|uniref:COP9 signalosome complex subunit 2 n=1 Tax=Perkinsus chesapeaki TaxID=330153 RepID=A0A7J6M732_PERCH|nr:COP9 signalosome complex subunit 2 [Perkinsus chesapeaki]
MEHLALAYVYATIPRWIFGALLCLASCVIINLGMVIQKRSVKFSAVSRPVYLQPQWLSGFTIFLLGQIVSLWSLSMAPQSMLSSLGSVSLVSNSILAPLLLGEKHTAVSLYSTGVLLAGSLLVVSCSSHQSQEYSPAALMDLFIRPQFLALTTVIVLSLGYLVLRRLRKGQLESVYFGTLSALLGALSVLFAKCVSILVLGGNALKPVDTTMRLAYILLLLLNITFSILSVYVMNLGIIRYRALDILPVYYSLAVVFQTITGGILFQEFVQLSFGQCLGLTLGVLLTCAGVQTIASGSPGVSLLCVQQKVKSYNSDHDVDDAFTVVFTYQGSVLVAYTVGVGLCLAACVISNMGMVVQKLSVYRYEEYARSNGSSPSLEEGDESGASAARPPDESASLSDGLLPKESMLVPVYRQPLWLLGFAVFLSGQLISMWALGMAPQSMLSSLGSFSLVSNSFLAPLILNEQHNSMSIYATVLLVAGSVMVVLFSQHSDEENTPEELARNLRGFPFIIMMITIAALLVGLATRAYRLRKIQQMLEPIYFGMVSALLGALSVLFAKCVSTLLHTLVSKHDDESDGIGIATGTAILIFTLSALCSLMSVYFMNLGLICFKALYILPVYYSLAIVFQTITGGVFFKEFSEFTVAQALGFSGGVLLTVAGVWVLTTADLASTCPEETSSSEEGTSCVEEYPRRAVVEVVENEDGTAADLESGAAKTSSIGVAAERVIDVNGSFQNYARSRTLPAAVVPISYSNPSLYRPHENSPATSSSPRNGDLVLDLPLHHRVPANSAPVTPRGITYQYHHAGTVGTGGGTYRHSGPRHRLSVPTPLTPAELARTTTTTLQHAMFDTTPSNWGLLMRGGIPEEERTGDWTSRSHHRRSIHHGYHPLGHTNVGAMTTTAAAAARAAMEMSSVTLLASQMVDCGARLDRAHTCDDFSPRAAGDRTSRSHRRRSIVEQHEERRRRSEGVRDRFHIEVENGVRRTLRKMSDVEEFAYESDGDYYVDDDYDVDGEGEMDDDAVELENAYYDATDNFRSNPTLALEQFNKVIKLERESTGQDSISWRFKALRHVVVLQCRLGYPSEVVEASYKQLLSYMGEVSKNEAQEAIDFVIDALSPPTVSSAGGPPSPEDSALSDNQLQAVYELTLEALMSARNDRLWFATSLKLAKLYLGKGQTERMKKVLADLHAHVEQCDYNGDEGAKSAKLLDVYSLELQVAVAERDNARVRGIYPKTLSLTHTIADPRNVAVIRESGGKLFMAERRWNDAYNEFFESFKNYQEAGNSRAKTILKYVVLASMLSLSDINPFDSREAKVYQNDPDVSAIVELRRLYEAGDVKALNRLLQNNTNRDAFITEYVSVLLINVRLKVLETMVRPYRRSLCMPEEELRSLLVRLVIEGRVDGGRITIVDDESQSYLEMPCRIQRQASFSSAAHHEAISNWLNATNKLAEMCSPMVASLPAPGKDCPPAGGRQQHHAHQYQQHYEGAPRRYQARDRQQQQQAERQSPDNGVWSTTSSPSIDDDGDVVMSGGGAPRRRLVDDPQV